jgi:ABC-type multidrug transport system ATPase subunit
MALRVQLQRAGKRYRREWIFRNLDLELTSGDRLAIAGPNGSGKSTLMQVLAGVLSLTDGTISFFEQDQTIAPDDVWAKVSIAAPYAELIEEFTLEEAVRFHVGLKPLRKGVAVADVFDLLQLPNSAKQKYIRLYSSGMKQRVKLALAVLSDSPLLLLDEPTITLDIQGIEWYRQLVEQHIDANRILIVASNVSGDFIPCTRQIDIRDYKK